MDREKVINHIVAEISIARTCKKDFASVDIDMLSDALALLKEQEAVKPRVSTAEQRCGNCNKVIEMDGWITCPWCGKPIQWETVEDRWSGVPDRKEHIDIFEQIVKEKKKYFINDEIPIRISYQCVADILALLKEQDEEHRRLLSWLGKFCRHIDNGDAWLTDEENIAFFKEKMKQQFGWDTN